MICLGRGWFLEDIGEAAKHGFWHIYIHVWYVFMFYTHESQLNLQPGWCVIRIRSTNLEDQHKIGQKSAKNIKPYDLLCILNFVTFSKTKYCIFPPSTWNWKISAFYWTPKALLPSEMPSFAHFAERYSYKQLGKLRVLLKMMDTPKRGGRFSHVILETRGKQLGDKEINSVNLGISHADGTWIGHLDGPSSWQDGLLQRPPHGEVEWGPTAFGIKLWGFWEDCQCRSWNHVAATEADQWYRKFHSESEAKRELLSRRGTCICYSGQSIMRMTPKILHIIGVLLIPQIKSCLRNALHISTARCFGTPSHRETSIWLPILIFILVSPSIFWKTILLLMVQKSCTSWGW